MSFMLDGNPKMPAGGSVLEGDAAALLQTLPASAIQTIITSPPYYGQRDYGAPGQLGAEPTPEEYVARLTLILDECKRVLSDSGTLWLNLGDKYRGGELLGMPWQVALALKKAGWRLRSDIIWHKPNAMPHSVRNRPTVDHEYIFLFSKSESYYFDQDAIREPHRTFTDASRMRGGRNHFGVRGGTPERGKNGGSSNLHDGRWDQAFHPKGRNRRTVWEIPLSKFRDTHFAVFPEELVRRCILAGSAPNDYVLDPFAGSGTTLVVADRLGRRGLGIDISAKYCEMARGRIAGQQLELSS